MDWLAEKWIFVLIFGLGWMLARHIDRQKHEINALTERVYALENRTRNIPDSYDD